LGRPSSKVGASSSHAAASPTTLIALDYSSLHPSPPSHPINPVDETLRSIYSSR